MHSKNDSYFRLDLGDSDGEIDGRSETWNWKTSGRSAPADSVPVPRVILQLVCADQVNTVQPVVLILPRLLPHMQHIQGGPKRKLSSFRNNHIKYRYRVYFCATYSSLCISFCIYNKILKILSLTQLAANLQ